MTRLLPAVCLALALVASGAMGVAATSQTETYELHLEEPNIAEAPNGDRVSVTGGGTFSVHPKSASAAGAFTHTDRQGNVLGSGTWAATELLSFQPYGCGVVHLPEGDVDLPDNFCGGKLMLRVRLTAGGQQFDGILTVYCIIGDKVPTSAEEGVRLNVIGVINFNKSRGGDNVYIRTS